MLISESRGKIRVGDWVKTNGGGSCKWFEGYVGEITERQFYIWQNERDGGVGVLSPASAGFKYSWTVRFEDSNLIEILKSPNTMGSTTSLVEQYNESLLDEPTKTFRKTGIIDRDNRLTSEGQAVFVNWLFQKHQDKFKTEVVDKFLPKSEESK